VLLCLDTVAWADEISFSSSIVDTTDSSIYLMTSATRRANDNLSRHGILDKFPPLAADPASAKAHKQHHVQTPNVEIPPRVLRRPQDRGE
jgi:hypothetical protein